MHHINKNNTFPIFEEDNFDENTKRLQSACMHISTYNCNEKGTAPQASDTPKFEDLVDDIFSKPELDNENSFGILRFRYMKEKHEPIRDYQDFFLEY